MTSQAVHSTVPAGELITDILLLEDVGPFGVTYLRRGHAVEVLETTAEIEDPRGRHHSWVRRLSGSAPAQRSRRLPAAARA